MSIFNRIISAIPNTITSLNLVSGCVSIFMAFHLNDTFGPLSGKYWAMIAMAAAALFDFLDGASARLLKKFSPLGADLDSLSDMVSFGVAPAMLVLNVMLDRGTLVWPAFAALLIPVFGALRLAKFNIDTTQSTVFRGLPIPANAIFWIGVVGWIDSYFYPGWLPMLALIAFMCWAMVGNFKMFSLKMKNFNFHENFIRYVLVVAAIIFVVVYGLSGFAWTVLLYFLLSFLRQSRI
ncbi:MAG: CDP-diacylglycerol--serine O-phosphatidyltransferase [Bacteroidales bacterium]|nr:CDP-diacylglycerol--serine O-phosphatidyltransferase [Bacteroidales bacterium]